jgi:ubiquinone/menaquinone biosynthesis C-methylase UbiE
VIGLDTSHQMLQMANVQTRYHKAKDTFDSTLHKQEGSQATPKFIRSNAESTKFEDKTFDLVTIMYLCHEAPKLGRYKIFREARRLLKPGGTLAVVDISPEYSPSATMLAGEPYVLEYQENIHEQIEKIQGFGEREYRVVVPGHVGMWLNTRL